MASFFDDKNLYDLYFKDISKPETIVRYVEGFYLDNEYKKISKCEAVEICKNAGAIICKPSLATCGGRGISFWDSYKDENELVALLEQHNYIFQRIQKQHDTLSKIYAGSLNTVRIMTLLLDDQCKVLSCVLRMGANGSKVDNVSSGGYAVGIHNNGQLKKYAYNNKGDHITVHPQGAVFEDYSVPNFSEFKELAMNLAYRLCRISKLVSWDFAVSPDGHPVLIEANMSWGELDFHQMCNGPIFGNETEKIWDWFKKKYL